MKDIKADPELIERLAEMRREIDTQAFKYGEDHDNGVLSILYGLQSGFTRFKNPIASIQLIEDVCGIDLLKAGESIKITDLYKAVYVMDNGPEALRHMIKAREKLRILKRIDPEYKDIAYNEMAEAEADLILAAMEYYETHFADADQVKLANALIESVGRVFQEFNQINIIEKSSRPVAHYKQPWSMQIAQIVAERLQCPVEDVLWKMPGERVISVYNQYLISIGAASKSEITDEQAKSIFKAGEKWQHQTA